jgi:hypothetical protein
MLHSRFARRAPPKVESDPKKGAPREPSVASSCAAFGKLSRAGGEPFRRGSESLGRQFRRQHCKRHRHCSGPGDRNRAGRDGSARHGHHARWPPDLRRQRRLFGCKPNRHRDRQGDSNDRSRQDASRPGDDARWTFHDRRRVRRGPPRLRRHRHAGDRGDCRGAEAAYDRGQAGRQGGVRRLAGAGELRARRGRSLLAGCRPQGRAVPRGNGTGGPRRHTARFESTPAPVVRGL